MSQSSRSRCQHTCSATGMPGLLGGGAQKQSPVIRGHWPSKQGCANANASHHQAGWHQHTAPSQVQQPSKQALCVIGMITCILTVGGPAIQRTMAWPAPIGVPGNVENTSVRQCFSTCMECAITVGPLYDHCRSLEPSNNRILVAAATPCVYNTQLLNCNMWQACTVK